MLVRMGPTGRGFAGTQFFHSAGLMLQPNWHKMGEALPRLPYVHWFEPRPDFGADFPEWKDFNSLPILGTRGSGAWGTDI
jgi:hypothetical protein